VKNDVYTWQAWNPYGGYDFYAGVGPCLLVCIRVQPSARRVVRSPYGYGAGAGDFLGNEYPLVRFAEKHGLDVTYATDLTVEQHPNVLLAHRALLSLGHDECWSLHERLAGRRRGGSRREHRRSSRRARYSVTCACKRRRSGRAAKRSITALRRRPARRPRRPPRGHRQHVERTPGELAAGQLRRRDLCRVPRTGADGDFVVADGSAWIFANTGLTTGAILPGLLRNDFDRLAIGPHPITEQIFAHSPIPAGATHRATSGRVYSDMTYYTDPTTGAGSSTAAQRLDPRSRLLRGVRDVPDRPVGIITGNLLAVLGRAPAGASDRRLRTRGRSIRRMIRNAAGRGAARRVRFASRLRDPEARGVEAAREPGERRAASGKGRLATPCTLLAAGTDQSDHSPHAL